MQTLTARKERKPLKMGQRPRNLSLDRSQTESDARLPGRETLAPRGQVSKVYGVWKAATRFLLRYKSPSVPSAQLYR